MHDDLIFVSEQVEIVDSQTVVVAGRRHGLEHVPVVPQPVCDAEEGNSARAGGAAPTTAELALASLLYWECYTRSARIDPDPRFSDVSTERDFRAALSQASNGSGTWEPGWRTETIDTDGLLVVSRHGVRFWAEPEQVRLGAHPFAAAQPCRVHVPHEYRQLVPGFHLIVGDAEPEDPTSGQSMTARLYWNLKAKGAPHFLAVISQLLNDAGIPFRAKVLSNPGDYQRADSAVVYLEKRDFPRARPLLRSAHAEVCYAIRSDVPLFTKRLAQGLAVAEDPGNGLSFGEDRCRLLARALHSAHLTGHANARSRKNAVDFAFRERGLDSEFPFLSPGSSECYFLEKTVRTPDVSRPRHALDIPNWHRCALGSIATAGRIKEESAFLEAAIRIGNALCSTAIWDETGERCTWIARSDLGTADSTGVAPRAAALGPDLYGGLGGTALYLAELFACTGIGAFNHAARAATNCARQQLEGRGAGRWQSAVGLYTGLTGTVLAACRVAARTGTDVASAGLKKLLAEGLAVRDGRCEHDLLSGRAGAVQALLALGRQCGWTESVEWATVLGEEICRSDITAWHRPSAEPEPADAPVLSGLSHGAAGVGLALLELYATTGQNVFLTCGRDAFSYEDTLFDPEEQNWADLRLPAYKISPYQGRRFAVTWCHGAPGIALSRLRASQLDPARQDHHLGWARIALETTRKVLNRQRWDRPDITSCHGVTGLIEVLWTGGLALDEPLYQEAALEAAGRLLQDERIANDCLAGVPRGVAHPSLMVGGAGLGYHFLRIYDPESVPSVLLVG